MLLTDLDLRFSRKKRYTQSDGQGTKRICIYICIIYVIYNVWDAKDILDIEIKGGLVAAVSAVKEVFLSFQASEGD